MNPRQPSWPFLVTAPDTTICVYSSRSLRRPVQHPTGEEGSPRLALEVRHAGPSGWFPYLLLLSSQRKWILVFPMSSPVQPLSAPNPVHTPGPDKHAKHAIEDSLSLPL